MHYADAYFRVNTLDLSYLCHLQLSPICKFLGSFLWQLISVSFSYLIKFMFSFLHVLLISAGRSTGENFGNFMNGCDIYQPCFAYLVLVDLECEVRGP